MIETHVLATAQARSRERRHAERVPAPRAPGWYRRLRAAFASLSRRRADPEVCC